MMTNVATLMARTYVNVPWSAGCQFQAFLVQMYVTPESPFSFDTYLQTEQVHAGRCILVIGDGRQRLSHLLLQIRCSEAS